MTKSPPLQLQHPIRDDTHQPPKPMSPTNRVRSARKYELDTTSPTPSPRDTGRSTETIEDNVDRHEHHVPSPSVATRVDSDDEDEEFHDIALEPTPHLVTKSIFKERKGFLTRLKDVTQLSSKKYGTTATGDSCVVPAIPRTIEIVDGPRVPQSVYDQRSTMRIERVNNIEIVLEEEEPIMVAIEQTDNIVAPIASVPLATLDTSFSNAMNPRRENVEDEMAPQVVIHSPESDSESGFATLNPIISRAKRASTIATSSSSMMAPATTITSPPLLATIPVVENSNDRLTLVINALGATGLAKAEKFGTQSSFLELRVCDVSEVDPSTAFSTSFFRTEIHKKGGSEAQWNQQFMTTVRSKSTQALYAAVRTTSKILIGETTIPLTDIGDSFYDQHYTIYNGQEAAGQIHLQLRLLCSDQVASITPVPSLHVATTDMRTARRRFVPTALRNGALMFKVPYHNNSLMGSTPTGRRQWVAVVGEDGDYTGFEITWCDPIDTNDKRRALDLSLVVDIKEGARTKAFERILQNADSTIAREKDRCFSLVTKSRTLDLVASSKEELQVWLEGLRLLVFGDDSIATGVESARVINDFRHSALSARDVRDTPTIAVPKKGQLTQWRNQIFDLARRNHLEGITTCLHEGCPIDLLETGSGDTLLMLACRKGNEKLVELCLAWRAKNDPHPEFGETALQVAVNAGYASCLALILSTAAKSDMDSEIVNHIDSKNDAPLHVAARAGDIECLQLLLHHGADICVVEEYGRTPLHCAVLSGKVECVAYLLDVGGDTVLSEGDHDGDTVLHYAALAGNESIVKLLLESAANVFATNIQNETPYDLAIRERHSACIQLIAKYYHVDKEPTCPQVEAEIPSVILHHSENSNDIDESSTICDEEDYETEILPCDSPVRKGPIEFEQEDERSDYYPTSAYSSTVSVTSSRPSHHDHAQPISPSARIREVLATHRQRVSLAAAGRAHGFHDFVESPRHYYSARDQWQPRYTHELSPREVYSDRMDRDQYHISPSYHSDSRRGYHYAADPMYDGVYGGRYYRRGHEYEYADISSVHRPRSHSASVTNYGGGYDQYGQWQPDPNNYSTVASHFPPVQRSSSADMTYEHSRIGGAWNEYSLHPHHHGASSTVGYPTVVAQPTVDEWDTYYSEEGYPYYINRRTGVSQWENPHETPVAVTNSTETTSGLGSSTLAADTQVRIRLAEVRQGRGRHVSEGSEATDQQQTPPPPIETDQYKDLPPSPTKYESRTGKTLSVDISSPIRVDETRPVFVPSPRSSKSPKNKCTSECANDTSFGQSPRASSPRGKIKHIPLLEIKRSNQLAMAFASFKLYDRCEQMIESIVMMNESMINAEFLSCLQRYFPTLEEIKVFQTYNGSITNLNKMERFFFLLLQVSDIQLRIDCFLYKLEFKPSYKSISSKIQFIKRACRDLLENYSFIQALEKFYHHYQQKSFQIFTTHIRVFKTDYFNQMDEKCHTFRQDLEKASQIEPFEIQMQWNRLVTGIRSIETFVDKIERNPQEQYLTAHDILQRFVLEKRQVLNELETEYETMGQWEEKLLDVFGESKAMNSSCQLSTIFSTMSIVLERDYVII